MKNFEILFSLGSNQLNLLGIKKDLFNEAKHYKDTRKSQIFKKARSKKFKMLISYFTELPECFSVVNLGRTWIIFT